MTKRLIALFTAVLMLLSLAACGEHGDTETTTEAPSTTSYIREVKTSIAAVKDVTGFGVSKIAKDRDYAYTVNYCDNAEQVKALVKNGKTDLAVMTLSDAVELYSQGVGVKVVAVNNLASMYVVAKGVDISDIADLKKHTIYSLETDLVTDYFVKTTFKDNGIDYESLDIQVKKDLNEISEIAANNEKYVIMLNGVDAAKLPVDEARKVAIDMTRGWITQKESLPVHTVVVARTEYIEANPEIMNEFRTFNEVSVNFLISNAETGAMHLYGEGFIDDSEIAMNYILNYSSLGYAEKETMKTVIHESLDACLDIELPGDDFYYID